MINNFRLLIDNKFRLYLFNVALQKEIYVNNIAKKLECYRDSIRLMKNGQVKFIKWQTIKKLLEIDEISYKELEKHVLAVKAGKSGRINETKFPIKESKELALLVAKGMGDGNIEKNFRFSYWNKEKELINEFSNVVIIVAGKSKVTINKLKDGRIQAKCNPFVGLIVHLNGVTTGNKTLQNFNVPVWIKNGTREIKASFIRGLFDDEAHVQFVKKNRRIIIAQCKWIRKVDSLENFFNLIRKILLNDFGIESTKVRRQNIFVDEKGRRKVILNFSISRKENLKKFYNAICFTSSKKRKRLKRILSSFDDNKIS